MGGLVSSSKWGMQDKDASELEAKQKPTREARHVSRRRFPCMGTAAPYQQVSRYRYCYTGVVIETTGTT